MISDQNKMDDEASSARFSHEDLDVFRRAYGLSLDLHRASLSWPKIEQYGGLGDQVRRASKSVCALIAEGAGRQSGSRLEFARYLAMAVGSAEEVRLWCRYAADLGYMEQGTADEMRGSYVHVIRMLNGLAARQRKGPVS